ncbi:hypothetical protein ACFOWA_13180 [Pedobacter lithocola]|uniref:Helix-turn-helix domain-containing protein n=1 Tax=Pedobacter lithocola TaxID=1908239 RepID=A0ABV8PEJ3_9SPHI
MESLSFTTAIPNNRVGIIESIDAQMQELRSEVNELRSMIASPPIASLPKYVDINGAAEITSKSPNALRIQISLGNLKSIKKGTRNYFDREYLENWISGTNLNNKSNG